MAGRCERAVITTHFHICAFVDRREDSCQSLAPFFQDADLRGERHLHLVAPDALDRHRGRLTEAGIDVCGCERKGQLALRAWPRADGAWDADRLIEAMRLATEPHAAAGGALRVTAQMDWATRPGVDRLDLLDYEARLNGVLAATRRPTVCVYDLAALDGATMMDLLRTHPLTMIGGVLRENPFFTPPPEMLRELSARRAIGRRLALPAPVPFPEPALGRRSS